MAPFFSEWFRRGLVVCLPLILFACYASLSRADECKRISNILVLFDASGFMKDQNRYQQLLEQMGFFEKAIPLTRDGMFKVGLRHYGLKVGLGCENTESILAVQRWDPQRFFNAFPKTISYGQSSLAAGLRAAADEIASLQGKSILLVIGGGIESCRQDPVKITQQICINNPDLEVHTFQVGGSQDGRFYLQGIAKVGRGVFHDTQSISSPAQWHAWMRRYLVTECEPPRPAPQAPAPAAPSSALMVILDPKSFSVRSKDPATDKHNTSTCNAVAQVLRQNPYARVVVHGFSDGRGNVQTNLQAAVKRAEAVRKYMMTTHGLAAGRVLVEAHAGPQRGAQGPVPTDERMGRRVELDVLQ